MPDVDPSDPRLPRRPLWGMLLLALPIVGVALTLAAYAGMWALGVRGRAAEGDAVDLVFTGCPEARPAIEARLADMGLPVAEATAAADESWAIRTTLPAERHVAERIPATLAQLGALEVRAGDEVLATSADVRDASVRMDLSMTPRTLVHVGEAAAERIAAHVRADPQGALAFWVDGRPIGRQANAGVSAVGEVEIDPPLAGRERWDATAAWSVQLDHVLPCSPEVTVRARE